MPSIVTLKEKGQVTLPAKLRAAAGLKAGDLMEARLEKGKIILEVQVTLPKGVLEGLEDLRQGRVHGPFEGKELKAWLQKEIRQSRKRQSK